MMKKKIIKTNVDSDDPWIHRNENMVCKTCIYYRGKASSSSTKIGRCRRHAPTMSGYPVVFENEVGCGDHKLDETKI